jgi:phenylacetaldehyde dehydrogenase
MSQRSAALSGGEALTGIRALLDRYAVAPAIRSFIARPHGLLLDGQWREALSGERIDVFEPSSGARMGSIASASASDVQIAIDAARTSMDDGRWSKLAPAERERVLLKLADLIEADLEFLAVLESLDNGKPLVAAREIDIPDALRFARYMAGWATKIDGRAMTLSAPNAPLGMTLREPVGVVGAIIPWNFPFNMAVQKVVPALAAGCSVVLKPAEQTSLTAIRLGELTQQAGVPDGVLNIVTGLGPTAGEALARHRDVAKLTFTGSTAVGTRLGQIAMENMTRLTLELGGKSPMIVLADSDLDRAAQGVVEGIFYNAGQVCCASSRLYVQESVHDALLERIATRANALRLAPGLAPDCEIGPLVSARQRDRVSEYIELGKAEGAELVAGGECPGTGYFVRPTVFSGLHPESRVMREEIFGPVVAVSPFRTDDEVVRLANGTRYGLAASIWSNDLARVRRLAGAIRAGTVWVNAHNPIDAALPFGGFGLSGFGREGGPEQLDAYLETKALWIAA